MNDDEAHVSRTRVISLIARREIVERVKSKMFIGSAAIFLVLILAGAILPGLLQSPPEPFRVGVVGARSVAVAEVARVAEGDQVQLVEHADRAAAEASLRAGDLDAVVADGREIIVEEEVEPRLGVMLESAHRQLALSEAIAGAGVPPAAIDAAARAPALAVRPLEPHDDEAFERRFIAYIGTVVLYMQLVFSGTLIANGIVEEKTSRVVELLLAKTRPAQLLTGKVLGMGLIGFVELLTFAAVGLGAATAAGTIDLPPATVRVGAEVVAWFVLGFGLYACLFAVAGALAGRPEDLQNTSQVVALVILVAYGAAFAAFMAPEGLISQIAAFVPISAPMVEPVRSAAGVATWWEPIVSAMIVVATMVVVIRFAARVYAGGAMHFQGTLKIRDALRRAGEARAAS